MRRLLCLLAAGVVLLGAQGRGRRQDPNSQEPPETRLPNGKLQQEEILKAEHEKTVLEVAQLVKLAEELQDELVKNDRHVLSLASLKKTEEIEKLARRIRTRLKK